MTGKHVQRKPGFSTCIALLSCTALALTEQKERGVAHSLQTRQLTRDGDYIPYPPDDSRV